MALDDYYDWNKPDNEFFPDFEQGRSDGNNFYFRPRKRRGEARAAYEAGYEYGEEESNAHIEMNSDC